MAYGNYEIITYGGGQVFVAVLQAVALVAGSSVLKSVMTVAMLTGLMIGILKAVFNFNIGMIIRWLIMSMIIYGVLWLPKVQVHVTDRFNAGLAAADIANVPLGVGFTAALSTEIGDTVITVIQEAFDDPASLSYSNTGMIYGSKLFSQMTSWQILDPSLANSLQAYIHDCVADDIIANNISMDGIDNSPALWAFLEANGNPAGETQTWPEPAPGSPATPSNVTCQVAAQDIDALWPAAITESQNQAQKVLGFFGAQGTAATPITQTVSDLTNASFGAPVNATDFFKQALTISAMKASVASYSGLAGGSTPLQVFSNLQAQNQNNATSSSMGQQAGTAIPILQLAMMLLFIGMFPVMMPAFLLPGIGPKMMTAYFGSFIYLQLWGPMYVILNKIFLYVTTTQTAASAFLPTGTSAFGGQMALTLANLASAASTNQQISNVAGMMMLSIPVIAGLLTKGAMDGGGAAMSAIGGFRAAAETAGTMEATRNISLGNTSLDNMQMQNTTGFNRTEHQDVTAPLRSFGEAITRETMRDGSIVTTAANGNVAVASNNSNVPIAASLTSGLSNSAGVAARESEQRTAALSNTWSQANTRTATAMSEGFKSFQEGRSSTDTSGADQRGSTGWVYSTLTSASDRLARDLNISKAEANSAVLSAGIRATVGAGAEGGLKIPFIAGVKGSAGINGSTGLDLSQSKSSTATEAERRAADILAQEGFSTKIDQTRQAFATQVLGSDASQTSGYRNVNSSAFANQSAFNRALAESQTQTTSYERLASQTRSGSWQQSTNYTNAYVNELGRRLADRSKPVVDATGRQYTSADIGLLLNPTGADRDQVSGFRDLVMQDFTAGYLAKVAAGVDGQVAADKTAAGSSTGLSTVGTLDVNQGGSGNSGRQPGIVRDVESRVGSGPLSSPTLPSVDPATLNRLGRERREAGKAGGDAATGTQDVGDRHPAGKLDQLDGTIPLFGKK